jgi:hypothetical protein
MLGTGGKSATSASSLAMPLICSRPLQASPAFPSSGEDDAEMRAGTYRRRRTCGDGKQAVPDAILEGWIDFSVLCVFLLMHRHSSRGKRSMSALMTKKPTTKTTTAKGGFVH